MNIDHLDVDSSVYRQELHHIASRIKRPNLVFDLGANVGGFTKAMVGMWPECEIHSFEPLKETYDKLKDNVGLYSTVTCYNFGFSDYDNDKVQVGMPPIAAGKRHNFGRTTTNFEGESIGHIKIRNFGKWLQTRQHLIPDFMKVDIEGNEFPVLKSALEFGILEKIPYIYAEINNHSNTKESAQKAKALLLEYYDVIWSSPFNTSNGEPLNYLYKLKV